MSNFKKISGFLHDTWLLGWYEIKSKYSRSTLGPFWITLNTLILISGLSIVSYSLFGMPMGKMVPWIGFGIITWNYILTTVDEATTIFLSPILLNIRTTPLKYSLIHIFKNVIIFAHNLLVAIPILIIFKIEINFNTLFIFYGFFILFVNSINFNILIGFLCLRYRDFILVIKNIFLSTFSYDTNILDARCAYWFEGFINRCKYSISSNSNCKTTFAWSPNRKVNIF